MILSYELKATLIEDMHTGSGTGGGDIDALVQLDRKGRPVIRASHFKGVLRENLRRLRDLDPQRFDQADGKLFGARGSSTGRGGALKAGSFYLDQDKEVEKLLWTSAAREEFSRTPRDDTLRVVEHIPAGTIFRAELRLADPGLEPTLDLLLRHTDRLGADRNRGGGLISLDVAKSEVSPIEADCPTNDDTRLRLVLRNLEPLCLPLTGVPGNLIATQSFLRSQVFSGALQAWAIERACTALDDAALDLFQKAHIKTTNDALPLPDGVAAGEALAKGIIIPIPLNVQDSKPEANGSELPWWLPGQSKSRKPQDTLVDNPEAKDENGVKLKRPGAHEYLYCTDDQKWQRHAPEIRVHMRNSPPNRDKLDSTRQDLFSVEEIAEDTRFLTELDFPDSEAAKAFAEAFAPLLGNKGQEDGRQVEWLSVGRGGQPVEVVDYAWSKPERKSMPIPFPAEGFTLTLLSDCLLRDERLAFLTRFDETALIEAAEENKKIIDEVQIFRQLTETDTLHGFNAATGLRRPPVIVLRRGSCIHVTGTDANKLHAALEAKPTLGERTHEGLGRFALNLKLDADAFGEHSVEPKEIPEHPHEAILANARKFAKGKAEEARQAAKKHNGEARIKLPSRSQLGWMRGQALACRNDSDFANLFENLEAAKTTKGGELWEHLSTDLNKKCDKYTSPEDKRLFLDASARWLAWHGEKRGNENDH